jgi:hypothetical protein
MTIRVWAILAAAACGLEAQSNDLTIPYTGKLLGYARTPGVQHVNQWGWRVKGQSVEASPEVRKMCESHEAVCERLYDFEPASGTSEVAKTLNALLDGKWPESHLLLGMGDNFAKDYFSRVVVAKMYSGAEEYIEKDELFYHEASKRWLDLRDVNDGPTFRANRAPGLGG